MRSRTRAALTLAAALLAAPAAAQDRPVHIWNPAWSPDGAQIVFEASLDGDGVLDLYVVGADGTGLTRLRDDAQNASFSPDGTRLVFIADDDGDLDIYTMAADGTDERKLTHNNAVDYGPAWHPGGAHIIYNSRPHREGYVHDLYRMDAEGTHRVQLTDSTTNDLSPVYSPDGTRIAFARGAWPDFAPYVMNADGLGARPLFARGATPDWSPDGTQITFFAHHEDNDEIYVVGFDGGAPVNLTRHPADDLMPAWSPDGTRIAFVSDRGGAAGLYLMDVGGENVTLLVGNPPR